MRASGLVTVILLFGLVRPTTAHGQFREAPTTTIRIHDYADAPAEQIARAQDEVTRLYGTIGVLIKWALTFRLNEASASSRANGCAEEPTLAILMLGQVGTNRKAVPERVLGTVPGTSGERGRIAYVFHDRVRTLAAEVERDPVDLLTLVLAHEIGHLLLPPGAHTSTGVMRALWNIGELRRFDVRQLEFTTGQAEDIHRRLTADEPERLTGAAAAPAIDAPL